MQLLTELTGSNTLQFNISSSSCVLLTCAVQWVVPGYHSNTGSSLSQAADLVVFDAAVHHCDSQTTTGVEYSRLLTTNKRKCNQTNKQVKSSREQAQCCHVIML